MADSTAILLNESAVNALKLSDPVGSVVKINTQRGTMDASVIGVIKDFNFQSLHQKVAPIIIGTWNNPIQSIDYFTLKVTGDAEELIPAITKVHEKFDQATPMEYHYLDEQLAVLYAAEKRVGMIFQMGGALSIFVACLGLLGLATYNIERRTKELGVRKVLGASALNLFLLLSSSFTRQVGIAYLIACPIAYFGMRQWLSIFEYRIPLHVGIFLSAGGTALLIALITISYRSLKAAYASPLNALRQE
jgi:putative ABC transport system permease protein